MAVDSEGNYFFFREYYLADSLVSVHRANITRLSEGEEYRSSIADPNIFYETTQKQGMRWSISNEYSDTMVLSKETAINWTKANNEEKATRTRINELLRIDPEHLHPITRLKGAPRLYFVKKTAEYPWGCDRAIVETRNQKRIKIGTVDGKAQFSDDRDKDVPDHAYDTVRYGVAARPAPHSVSRERGTQSGSYDAAYALLKASRVNGSGPFAILAELARSNR